MNNPALEGPITLPAKGEATSFKRVEVKNLSDYSPSGKFKPPNLKPKLPLLFAALLLVLSFFFAPDLIGSLRAQVSGGSAIDLSRVLDESFNLSLSGKISGSRFTGSRFTATTTSAAPFTVSSSTLVTNLNSDLLDGQQGTYYLNWNNFSNTPTILSSLDGVSNDQGNIDLIAGSNISITPDDLNNSITISSSGGISSGWVDDGTVVRLETAADKVGIGTSSPDGSLHVFAGEAGTSPNSSFDNFVIEGNGITGMSILSPDTSAAVINFGHASNNTHAEVRSDLTGGYMTISSDADIRLQAATGGELVVNEIGRDQDTRIEGGTDANLLFVDASTDRLGIGTTTPSQKLDLIGAFELEDTTSSTTGVVYKGATPFIHNFHHPTGGTAVPVGENTFLGLNAGNFTMGSTATSINQASENVAVGYEALTSNTIGWWNTAVGHQALTSNTTGDNSTAVGHFALSANTDGYFNTAVGGSALLLNDSGDYHTAAGWGALRSNTSGFGNTALGYRAVFFSQTGGRNAAVGYEAGYGSSGNSYSHNSLLGYRAGYSLTTGGSNIMIGSQAGDNITSGATNILIGYNIDAPTATTNNFMSLGNLIFATGIDGTGTTVSTGDVGIGTNNPSRALDLIGALELEDTTSSSTGVIYKGSTRFIHNFHHPTGDTSVPAGENVFLGENAGNFTIGSTASSSWHGSYNTAVGYDSFSSATTGHRNTAIGRDSLNSLTTGSENVAVGHQSLNSQTSGIGNVGVGAGALFSNGTTGFNTAIGNAALVNHSTGNYTVALGANAGRYHSGNQSNSSSTQSLFLGSETEASASGNTNEIVIGYDAVGLGSNTAVLGNDSITTTALKGNIGIGTTTSINNIITVVQSSTTDPIADAWTTYSSIRWKEDITSMDNALERLSSVDPVYFDWKEGYGEGRDFGFIAEEIGKEIPEVVEWEEDGTYAKSVDYAKLSTLAISAIQELNQKVENLSQQAKTAFESLTAKTAEIASAVIDVLQAGSLTVGESKDPTGITIFDRETGDPYCVFVSGGEVITEAGVCE